MNECFLCGRNGSVDPLDTHHIFGGARRKLSEKYGLKVRLCHDRCHENGRDAVQNNPAVMDRLHRYGQQLAMEKMGWGTTEFVLVFGKNYLDDWSDGPIEREDPFADAPGEFVVVPMDDPDMWVA